MDMEIAVFLGSYIVHSKTKLSKPKPVISVVFLLTSSVATVAICCLELKAVWISYRQVSPT